MQRSRRSTSGCGEPDKTGCSSFIFSASCSLIFSALILTQPAISQEVDTTTSVDSTLQTALDIVSSLERSEAENSRYLEQLRTLVREDSSTIARLLETEAYQQELLLQLRQEVSSFSREKDRAIQLLERYRPTAGSFVLPVGGALAVALVPSGLETRDRVLAGVGTYAVLLTLEYVGYGGKYLWHQLSPF